MLATAGCTTSSAPATPDPSTAADSRPSVPFPDESSTGAKGELETYRGDQEISEEGAVIANVEIQGRLTVRANNVTIRNVRLTSSDYWAILNYGANTLIEDSTLTGSAETQASIGDIDGGSFVGRRLNISGAADGVKMAANSKLYDSYVHDLATFDGAHNDGIEMSNAINAEVVHNTILNANSQTSAIFLGDYVGGVDANVLVKDNLLAGGGYTIYGGAPELKGARVLDNRISTRYFPQGGGYGPLSYWSSTGNSWSGNLWADGPQGGHSIVVD